MNENPIHHKIEKSAILTVIGILLLFSTAVIVTLLAPHHVDPTWTQPTTAYQTQMYEVSDPNLYISSASGNERQQVYHLKANYTLLAFQETELMRIVAPVELEKYITHTNEGKLKLTSRLLLLRTPKEKVIEAEALRSQLQSTWEKEHPAADKERLSKPTYEILELYAPNGNEAFVVASTDGIVENWVDAEYYTLLDETPQQPYHRDPGVIYILNPEEYRITRFISDNKEQWRYDPEGAPISSLDELRSHPLGFMSRQELIYTGEHLFAIEGCWYCHSDQTRTLIQDTVLNGSDSYPAPPSSANEYIYQKITFLSTRRIGPDLSRVGIKRPSRDWHRGHFWSPKTASRGSIMPSFKHFFDNDPRGVGKQLVSLPNYKFEALFQYLMTKGTRITPPTQAWWLGQDPIQTKELIEGRKQL